MQRCIVVIPTYNEAENLPLIVPLVLARNPGIEVLVVDDNSPDGTGEIADDLAKNTGRVHVLHRTAKEGLGAAYRDGLAKALDLDAELIIQMDADFSHPPESIDLMLKEIEDHDSLYVHWPLMLSIIENLTTACFSANYGDYSVSPVILTRLK